MIQSDRERQAPTTIEDAEPSHLVRYEFATKFLDKNSTVLDIPCGSGYGSGLMSRYAKDIIGIDLCKNTISHCSEFFSEENNMFAISDMEDLRNSPIYKKQFDFIVSFEGIEHIEKQREFLKETARLLSDKGKLIISTPRKPHGSPYHKIEHSLESFKELLGEFFIIEKMYGQIYTDIFDLDHRYVNPHDYQRFNFIAVCKKR